jgi:hypothetical protein
MTASHTFFFNVQFRFLPLRSNELNRAIWDNRYITYWKLAQMRGGNELSSRNADLENRDYGREVQPRWQRDTCIRKSWH